MEAARSLALPLYFSFNCAALRGLHGAGVFTHLNVFCRLSSSSSFIPRDVQTFTSAPLTDKHLFCLTHDCLSSVLTNGAILNALDKNVLQAFTLLQLQTDLVQTSKPRFSSNAREPLRRSRISGAYSLLMFFHASNYSGLNITSIRV